MKSFRRAVLWPLHTGSWILALYLFATGNIWGGFGAASVSLVMGLIYTAAFVVMFLAAAGEAEEIRNKIRKEAEEKARAEERKRFRSA